MATRRPVFAANWKMNTTVPEGVELFKHLRQRLDGVEQAEVVICPPFTHLTALHEALQGSRLRLGAQNLYWEEKGAFTGEISPAMLRGVVSHVIIGHSERRQLFGESDADVNRKLRAALEAGLVPIVCVGETGEQRQREETEQVLRRQIHGAAEGLSLPDSLLVAYEPVWAIGTGVAAHGPQAQAAIAFIRSEVRSLAGAAADRIRMLYGGSVAPANIAEFMAQPDVDGALVGGASLAADSFSQIVQSGLEAVASRGNG